ncbi:hypothetical protein D7X99_08595 [Corallococcus sp. AB032C]|nr:hypothetical protein D7X99_08595 [Corallococcus sp. AB032C]
MPEERYRMYKVQVLRRENEGTETMKLVFNLVGPNADEVAKDLYVFLYIEPYMVWPELPSTAHLAKDGQFAYLLLSPTFMKDRAKAPKAPDYYAEPGGKWPIGAGALHESAVAPNARMLQALTEFIQALAGSGRER